MVIFWQWKISLPYVPLPIGLQLLGLNGPSNLKGGPADIDNTIIEVTKTVVVSKVFRRLAKGEVSKPSTKRPNEPLDFIRCRGLWFLQLHW